METIGFRVKKLIENKGVTAYEVAAKTGISESTLSRIISKDSKPNLRNSEILAEYFEVSKQYLLTGVGDMEVIKKENPQQNDESLKDKMIALMEKTISRIEAELERVIQENERLKNK